MNLDARFVNHQAVGGAFGPGQRSKDVGPDIAFGPAHKGYIGFFRTIL